MRNGWRETTLGEVATQHIDGFSVLPDETYTNLGVQWYAGGTFARDPKRGSDMKATRLFRVKPGQFIYNRMFVTEGSFALVSRDHADGVVSNEFPAFDLDEAQILPEYLLAYFQQPEVWRAVADEASGTTKSRRRWKESQFLARTITLPPLDEQRRIVDLIAAVDDAVDAAEAEAAALDAQLQLLRTRLFGQFDDVHVSDLIEKIEGGRSVQAAGRPPGPGEIGVIKLSAVNERGFIAAESKTLASAEGFTDRMLIRTGDVLVTRANTSERVGMTCLVDAVRDGLYLSDKTLRIVPKAGVVAETLVHALQSPRVRKQFSAFGTGTSASMQNISQKDIGRARTGWPTDTRDQVRVGNVLTAHTAASVSARATAELLRTLRSNLLTVLLSGEHEIPASYDALLGEVA